MFQVQVEAKLNKVNIWISLSSSFVLIGKNVFFSISLQASGKKKLGTGNFSAFQIFTLSYQVKQTYQISLPAANVCINLIFNF